MNNKNIINFEGNRNQVEVTRSWQHDDSFNKKCGIKTSTTSNSMKTTTILYDTETKKPKIIRIQTWCLDNISNNVIHTSIIKRKGEETIKDKEIIDYEGSPLNNESDKRPNIVISSFVAGFIQYKP